MAVSSSNKSFILFLVLTVVQGALEPNGVVSLKCRDTRTFICRVDREPLGWKVSGLRGISIPGHFRARPVAQNNARISTNDSGGNTQVGVSNITISGFSLSDNGGTIQCINMHDSSVQGMATISVVSLPLPPPTNLTATVESCNVMLQWEQPRDLADSTSVSCTPHSPGCAECRTSPCTITGLNPSTEYVFTVTLKSGQCKTNMSRITAKTMNLNAPTSLSTTVESCDNITLRWTQPRRPENIITSVGCTPHSPGCAECMTSPCTITGLNPSTEYVFTVTFKSGGCRASMNTTVVRTKDLDTPTSLSATVESCDTVTLQWNQLSKPNDITTSVTCTPHSTGCTECTTSPCTITGLNPSTEYVFTVTLNSGGCTPSMNTTGVVTRGLGTPTKVVAELVSCDSVFLQWTQPSEPADITASVSCAPHSPGCAACTTSQCTITGLSPSTEYEFTVILNSSVCGTSGSKYTTEALQIDASSCIASNSTTNDTSTDISSGDTSLAALVVLTVLIPLIYPLGVLIAKFCCFRDKSYCEVFWCCGCCRKDKSPRCNSTVLMKSPHPGEEVEYQIVNKGKHNRFVTDGKENKDQRGNKQEHVVTYETVEQLGDDDGDVITDETVQQQGNEDGIQYATLDFSGHRKGNINVIPSKTDEVTYAAV